MTGRCVTCAWTCLDGCGPCSRVLCLLTIPVAEPFEKLGPLAGPQSPDPPAGIDPQLLHGIESPSRADPRQTLKQDLDSGPRQRLVSVCPSEGLFEIEIAGLQFSLQVRSSRS